MIASLVRISASSLHGSRDTKVTVGTTTRATATPATAITAEGVLRLTAQSPIS